MRQVDLVVLSDHVYTMAGKGVGYFSKGGVAIDRGKIIAVAFREEILANYKGEKLIDRPNTALFPGLIDAHMHMCECILRGLAQDTGNWMMYGFGPFAKSINAETRQLGTKLAFAEGIKAGTTTFGESGYDLESVCQLVKKIGVRGNLTSKVREAVDRIYAPGELYEFSEEDGRKSLEATIDIFEKWNLALDGRIKILFGPQGADFLSKEGLLKVREEAKKRNAKIQMHTQQGERETKQMMKRYGMRPIPWLDSIGYLDENLIAVHLTDANDEEAALAAKRGAGMILCSGSIGIIDGMVPPAKVFQDTGGAVALGSDQAPGNNCHNIINEMKLTALFNKIKYTDPEAMPAWKVLRMATIEGAKALGLDQDIGSIEEGKRADLISVDLNSPSMTPVFTEPMRNIVPNLVYSARGQEVCLSIVDGKIIYENGAITGLDEKELLIECNELAKKIGKDCATDFWAAKGTNASFMQEGKL